MSRESKAFVEAKHAVLDKGGSFSPHQLIDLAISEALKAAHKYQRTPEQDVENFRVVIDAAMAPILARNKELEARLKEIEEHAWLPIHTHSRDDSFVEILSVYQDHVYLNNGQYLVLGSMGAGYYVERGNMIVNPTHWRAIKQVETPNAE